jgi:hypothetical protein
MPAVTITVVVGLNDGSPQYVPVSQSANPDKVLVPLGRGPQTVTFTLTPGAGSPETTTLLFAQNSNGMGNTPPITFKPVTASDIAFPQGWNAARQAAFVAAVQTALNGVVPSSPPNSPSVATITFDPSTFEGGQALEIDLPYTVNYWINVQGVSWGMNYFDPEVDIDPGS